MHVIFFIFKFYTNILEILTEKYLKVIYIYIFINVIFIFNNKYSSKIVLYFKISKLFKYLEIMYKSTHIMFHSHFIIHNVILKCFIFMDKTI